MHGNSLKIPENPWKYPWKKPWKNPEIPENIPERTREIPEENPWKNPEIPEEYPWKNPENPWKPWKKPWKNPWQNVEKLLKISHTQGRSAMVQGGFAAIDATRFWGRAYLLEVGTQVRVL